MCVQGALVYRMLGFDSKRQRLRRCHFSWFGLLAQLHKAVAGGGAKAFKGFKGIIADAFVVVKHHHNPDGSFACVDGHHGALRWNGTLNGLWQLLQMCGGRFGCEANMSGLV